MQQLTTTTPQLPKLADLHGDIQTAFKDDLFLTLVNQPPHQSWIKKHPITKGEYIPIDKIEFMLTRIFQQWRCEVLTVQSLFQSIQVTVRLHYRVPTTGEWTYQDGVGAAPIQTDAGQSASNLAAIKANAVQIATPSAKSYALKDAAEHIGKLFGRDLNRKDTLEFAGAYSQQPAPETAPAYQAPAEPATQSPNEIKLPF